MQVPSIRLFKQLFRMTSGLISCVLLEKHFFYLNFSYRKKSRNFFRKKKILLKEGVPTFEVVKTLIALTSYRRFDPPPSLLPDHPISNWKALRL